MSQPYTEHQCWTYEEDVHTKISMFLWSTYKFNIIPIYDYVYLVSLYFFQSLSQIWLSVPDDDQQSFAINIRYEHACTLNKLCFY